MAVLWVMKVSVMVVVVVVTFVVTFVVMVVTRLLVMPNHHRLVAIEAHALQEALQTGQRDGAVFSVSDPRKQEH